MKKGDKKINWAILVTGWGRNAKDTLEAFDKGKFKRSKASVVIYESEPCGAANKAKEIGVEVLKMERSDYPNLIAYQAKLIKELKM